jgi:hypothetical protein
MINVRIHSLPIPIVPFIVTTTDHHHDHGTGTHPEAPRPLDVILSRHHARHTGRRRHQTKHRVHRLRKPSQRTALSMRITTTQ